MIVMRMTGGLGNQMFQYAFGRAYAETHRLELKVDLTPFSLFQNHNGYELPRLFEIAPPVASTSEMVRLTGNRNYRFAKALRKYTGFKRKTFFLESDYTYSPPPPPGPGGIYFDGYFVSPKYFENVRESLRKEFSFKPPSNSETDRLLKEIQSSDRTVSIHIRRGDFLTSLTTMKFHGVLGLEYYRLAVARAFELLNKPEFYVFSDDPDWCKKNLEFAGATATFVSHNRKDDSWQDMYLMSRCRLNVMANSSFSWWGAWLNPNQESIKIAPSPWYSTRTFSDVDLHTPGTEALPPSFLKLGET